MALTLARGETILYPMPYVEAEAPPYVVTNQRLIESLGGRERVLTVKNLASANRAQSRPFAALGALLLCLGLGLAAAGGYFYYTVLGMEAAPYTALYSLVSGAAQNTEDEEATPTKEAAPTTQLPDDPSVEGGDTEKPEQTMYKMDVLKTRVLGMLLGAGGIGLLLLGLRVFAKKRYFVVCRAREGIMRIVVGGKTQQDIILATLQAVQ
jgi:hypothetical protein